MASRSARKPFKNRLAEPRTLNPNLALLNLLGVSKKEGSDYVIGFRACGEKGNMLCRDCIGIIPARQLAFYNEYSGSSDRNGLKSCSLSGLHKNAT